MRIKIVNKWTDTSSEGKERYATLQLSDGGKVDVKIKSDGFVCVMLSGNGYEVYKDTDNGYRDCTNAEAKTIFNMIDNEEISK